MATVKICDRCGAKINSKSSAIYVLLRDSKGGMIGGMEYELCCSCAMQLREFLKPLADEEGSTE